MSKELTQNQRRFADEYIISGNATDAYKKAYPNVTKDSTANTNSSRLLRNAKVSAYVAERVKEAEDERLMDVQEALMIEASIARGETQKGYSKHYDRLTDEVIKETDYEFTPTIEERQRSLDHLLKVHGAFIDKKQIDQTNHNIEITIGDWNED